RAAGELAGRHDVPAPPPARGGAAGGYVSEAGGPASLLDVEDDEKIRAGLVFQLRTAGFAPRAVASGEAAWQALTAEGAAPPDLLLVDVRVPGMSGVELLQRLGTRGPLPRMVIVSGGA